MVRLSDWKLGQAPCSRWWAEQFGGGLRSGQSLGHNRVSPGIESHPDVSAGNLDVFFRVHGHAIAPIDDAILARINRGLEHRVGNLAVKRTQKITGAASGIAIGQNALSVLLENAKTNSFGDV